MRGRNSDQEIEVLFVLTRLKGSWVCVCVYCQSFGELCLPQLCKLVLAALRLCQHTQTQSEKKTMEVTQKGEIHAWVLMLLTDNKKTTYFCLKHSSCLNDSLYLGRVWDLPHKDTKLGWMKRPVILKAARLSKTERGNGGRRGRGRLERRPVHWKSIQRAERHGSVFTHSSCLSRCHSFPAIGPGSRVTGSHGQMTSSTELDSSGLIREALYCLMLFLNPWVRVNFNWL